MKMLFGKSIAAERLRGRKHVDEFFLYQIAQVLGTKADLYAAKYTMAVAHQAGRKSNLIVDDDDAQQIIDRHHADLDKIAALEKQRQAMQARVDLCEHASDVDALLERVFNSSKNGN